MRNRYHLTQKIINLRTNSFSLTRLNIFFEIILLEGNGESFLTK